MKRKLISLAVLIAIFLSHFSVTSFAAGFSDTVGMPCETAVNYLAEKGIVNGRSEGVYAPDEGLTRAEMVAIILRAYGAEEIEDIEKFIDVPPTHWAYMYVETAYKMGIVNGMTETTFAPDGAVTYEQAVKMLVCAMNRRDTAEEEGGWPDGYIKVAADMGVLEGIAGQKGQAITRGTMAQLVYNCLRADVSESYMINWDGVAEHYNWIRDEKIRGIYGALSIIDEDDNGVLKRLENAGVNTVFLNLTDPLIEQNKNPESIKTVMDKAVVTLQRYNLHPFIKINFGDNGYTGNNAFGTFHPGIYKDSYFNSPCPLSEEYWNRQLVERAVLIAQYKDIEGIILDFEMYSGGSSNYASPCMCDDCWEEYIIFRSCGSEWAGVPAAERNAYITAAGKSDDYREWFTANVVSLFENVREKVHAVNPDIIFAYFPGFEWLPGITRGLGTPRRPVIVASEVEYWGSLAETQSTMQKINDEDYHAIYLPGLYPGKEALTPQQLEQNIKLCAPTTAGYWMYAAQTLREVEENYSAVENANRALDEMIKSGKFTSLPTYDVPYYTATKIAGSTPTEKEWADAPLTDDFLNYRQGADGTVPVRSHAKILYSDRDIFVRIIAYDDMSTVSVGSIQPRDADLSGDRLTVYWRFDGSAENMHVSADLAGSHWDACGTGIGTENVNVNYEGLETNALLFDDRWEMTMRIPGSIDGVRTIDTGDVLRMEIGRNHPASRAMGLAHYHCWAPTYGSFLGSPSLWGYVTLG